MMTVYQTPEFDRDSLPVSEFTPALVEQGRQLFYSKFACQSCHIADYKNDKGYIGPGAGWDRQALQRSLGLSLAERSAGVASRNYRAQPAHDRRRGAVVDCISDVAQVGRRTGGDEEMKPVLIAVCAVTLLMVGMFSQDQAACTTGSYCDRSGDRRIQRREADWIHRNAAGSAGRGAGERRLRQRGRRSGGVFQRTIRREF